MEEGGGGGGGGGESVGGGGGTAKAAEGEMGGMTSFEVGGGRQRFTVELRPGETTIVSWKKLLKDAKVSKSNAVGAVAGPKPLAASSSAQVNNNHPAHSSSHLPHPSLDPRFGPGQVGENEGKDAPQPSSNRLNTVIERIERLYVGKASSDEEDLNDVIPDDDEYDTEDSFIDDTELDEYFEVDNSAIKHDGFFVNRGKLERVEPSSLPNEQPKKRRRKDLSKGHDGSDSGDNPNKHVRLGKKAGKSKALVGRNASGLIPSTALPNTNGEDGRIQNQISAAEISLKKKSADAKTVGQPHMGVMNGDVVAQEKFIDQQKIGALPANSQSTKLKEGTEYSDTSYQRSHDKSSYTQSKSVSGKLLSNVGGLDHHVQQKEKISTRERPEIRVPENKNSSQTVKVSHVQKKEGSSNRPKGTMLEKAIRDLEKLVAESRPPAADVQDADNSSQAIKRRLSPEVKQKLAKVARLAQASHGKISNELINRLMSIVGHLIQLRTLKRNLKIMVTMGLSAKQEKDNRVQLVKKEVAEMVKIRISFMKSKALEQQVGTSDDFEVTSAEENEAFKRKYSMDDALEDKICDLYDLYIEGLEEDAGPQVRKLYAELSALWPNGFMDNVHIKRAICRAKDRRRKSYSRHKESEKIKRKKIFARKAEDTVRIEANTLAQPFHIQEKSIPDSIDHGLAPVSKPVSSSTVAGAGVRMPVSFMNGSNMYRPKQEKIKGSARNSADIKQIDASLTKKIKRKAETEPVETQFRSDKLPSSLGDEKNKSKKSQVSGSLPKSSLQPAAPSSFEQLS